MRLSYLLEVLEANANIHTLRVAGKFDVDIDTSLYPTLPLPYLSTFVLIHVDDVLVDNLLPCLCADSLIRLECTTNLNGNVPIPWIAIASFVSQHSFAGDSRSLATNTKA